MKEFFLILGGAGVGKNYYIERNLPKTARIVDIDNLKTKMPLTRAISSLKSVLLDAFESGKFLIAHPSLGKNPNVNISKLKLAKDHGYKTTVVLLQGSPEQGIENVKKRVKNGGHNVLPQTILKSYARVKTSFDETIKSGSKYIDYIKQINTTE